MAEIDCNIPMPPKGQNQVTSLVGKTFNELTVIERQGSTSKRASWLCKCSCGKITTVTTNDLKHSKTRSCGHLRLAENPVRPKRTKEEIEYNVHMTTVKQMQDRRNNRILSGKFFGVYPKKARFLAQLGDKKLGVFITEVEAAKAYDKASFEKYGEPSILNFPEDYF